MQKLSDKRNITFIPSVEVSPSWGHFNPFPIKLGSNLSVDPGVDTVHDIFADLRKMDAVVIAANHPYITYGYLTSLKNKISPGGFNSGIDLFEINSSTKYMKVVEKVRAMWNDGLRYYYTAGSDAHDVWNDVSGAARMFAYTGSCLVPHSNHTDCLKIS